MRGHRVGAEPGGHVAAGQRGELPDVADSHAPQQIRQIFTAGCGQARLGGQLPDRQRGQEQRVLARLDDPARPCGEDGGGQLVGDADLAFGPGRGHRVDQPLSGGLLGPEVAGRAAHRQHQQAGPQHLGARHQVVHRGRHVFEVAGVAGGIGGDDVQLRAPGLSFPAAQAAPHPGRAGRRRTGDHPVGQRDRDRRRRGQTRRRRRGDRGPVHAPDGQHPWTAEDTHPPTARTEPKDRPLARMASRTLLIRPHPGVGDRRRAGHLVAADPGLQPSRRAMPVAAGDQQRAALLPRPGHHRPRPGRRHRPPAKAEHHQIHAVHQHRGHLDRDRLPGRG